MIVFLCIFIVAMIVGVPNETSAGDSPFSAVNDSWSSPTRTTSACRVTNQVRTLGTYPTGHSARMRA